MKKNPYLPELDWSDIGLVLPPHIEQIFLDAEVKAPARGPGALRRVFGALQSVPSRVTAATGRAVLWVTKSPNVCQARGHQIVGRPWVEVPGHYENWHRVVGCECGKILHLQSCHNHQNPSLSFLAPKKDGAA